MLEMKARKILFAVAALVFVGPMYGQNVHEASKDIEAAAPASTSVQHRDLQELQTRLDAREALRKIVQAAKGDVNSVRANFKSTKLIYEESREAARVKNRLLVDKAYEERDNDLAKLQAYCERVYSITCSEATQNIHSEHEKELARLATELSEDKRVVVDKYLAGLAQVGLEGLKADEGMYKYYDEVDAIQKQFPKLKDVCNEKRVLLDNEQGFLKSTEEKYNQEIEKMNRVLMRNICFEFNGASGEIPPDQIVDFNTKMKIALELAFIEAGVDMKILAFVIVAQNFVHGRRYLTDRRLRRKKKTQGKLQIDSVVGMQCNCKTDALASDVSYRHLVGKTDESLPRESNEGFRRLSGQATLTVTVMENFARTVQEIVGGVFGSLVSVNTFTCADMTIPPPTSGRIFFRSSSQP